MARIETVFRHLLAAAREQMALARANAEDASRLRALGICVRSTLDRLDRVAVLIVVRMAPKYGRAPQHAIAVELDMLHGSADPLLARVPLSGEIAVRRFATRLTALDPLSPFRSRSE